MSIGTEWGATGLAAEESDPGAISVTGRVFDGSGAPVTDAMLEFWQADRDGHFPPESPRTWTGFTRALTDGEGRYRLVTVKPAPVPGPDGRLQAPHVDVSIFARGLLQRLVTRIYFSDEGPGNETDPVLVSLGSPSLVTRLVASRVPGRHDVPLRHPPPGRSGDRFLCALLSLSLSLSPRQKAACSGRSSRPMT